ncbi:MAG: enoyl-CoA hydratase/isomerase family protein [Myxococcota bacterium]|nr:enoyl-CoA hydratase/isomerase family protein [Myxococcota bacterium]
MDEALHGIRLERDLDGRRWIATIEAPPINLMTLELFGALATLSARLHEDERVQALVLRSADPDFFIAHFDVEAILRFPIDGDAPRGRPNAFHQMCERFRTAPAITMVEIDGRVGGGGSELSLACDLRFGSRERCVVNQMEVPLGILPGGGGTQRLPRLLGRGRALEVVLGGDDLDAETAERWGYLNRALPASELRGFVSALSERIARHPREAVRLAKRAVDAANGTLAEGLEEEDHLFQRLLRDPEARRRMQRFGDIGGQTREGELRVAELGAALADDPEAT